VLKNLLADATVSVRVPAAVSLLILGQDAAAQRPLLEFLGRGNPWDKISVVRELGRVKDVSRWEFARPSIKAVAADMTIPDEFRRQALALLQMKGQAVP